MVLDRVWLPSPNYSSSRSRTQLLVVHTSEGATTFRNLGAFLANPAAQVSYQVGFDDTSSSQIGEYVRPQNKAWAAMAANDWGEHGCCCTPSGASAGWTRDIWLNQHPVMLAACAAWLAEESARYGIPLVKVDGNGILAGHKGVCGHADVTAAGAGGSHFDPGGGFPWSDVIAMAAGSPGPAPSAEDYVLIGTEWYPMSIFQSDADARQAAALTWWAQYLSRTPDAPTLANWAARIEQAGYAGALNEFLHTPEVTDRLAHRPW